MTAPWSEAVATAAMASPEAAGESEAGVVLLRLLAQRLSLRFCYLFGWSFSSLFPGRVDFEEAEKQLPRTVRCVWMLTLNHQALEVSFFARYKETDCN